MRVITIGIDPHKSSHTAVAIDAAGHKIGQHRFVINVRTFRQLMRWSEQWPERRFAMEGADGLGRRLAQKLAAAGEDVVGAPSTLPARARLLATLTRPQDRPRRRPPCCAGRPLPHRPAEGDSRGPVHHPQAADRTAQ
ncbi:transposase [Streptomyces sp. NPDC005953]|uniref:IS110 family transposase n=1 Tax=Streptomyces sp. NPDC005953 TaxID=3156719 RepID=UPI0033DF1B8F